MKNSIPESMQALFIDKESGNLICRQVAVPVPGKGEVLIKMHTAPINPSDLARIRSAIAANEFDTFIPGVEGSGVVVVAGAGLFPKLRLGKRVACTSVHNHSGSWAEYMVTAATRCFPVNEEISSEQASMMLVNPMTALAFIDLAKKGKHPAVINTAAASSLGKLLNILAAQNGISVINIVRNESQVNTLKKLGISIILNETETDFIEKLRTLAKELNAGLLLDAVGGKHAAELIEALPGNSSVIIYGNLSGEPLEVYHKSLIPGNKKISGFFLGQWAHENGILKSLFFIKKIKQLLSGETETIIQQKFPLEKTQEALDTYLKNMSAGKVLWVMGEGA